MHLTLLTLLAALGLGLVACGDPDAGRELTPIEETLLADSLYRATQSDSATQHIVFDYENLNRSAWQKPELVLRRLGPLADKTVVEIGSGTGFFTRRLATEAREVLALDIDASMLLLLDSLSDQQLDPAAYARIDKRLVSAEDPDLAAGEANAALMVNTFMYIHDRATYLRRLAWGLRPGSPVVIVDFMSESTPVGPPVDTRLPTADAVAALEDAGYRNIAVDEDILDYQYILYAESPAAN